MSAASSHYAAIESRAAALRTAVPARAAARLATAIGTLFGAFTGFLGGWLGDLFEGFYSVFTAVPSILLIFAFAAILGRGIESVVLILAFSGWTGVYHILPNVAQVILIQLSLNVVAFTKVEVFLSFLGLGVPVDSVSWGTMLNEAQSELMLGKWWQLAAVTLFMGTFVTAFSLFTDALRDALDPRLA